jgi:prepilin-type N-terminal cleavage/methylation domain-containing protein
MNRQKSMERPKLNNRGFSLVELIVVIAVIVVLGAATVSLTGLLNGRQAKQAREQLFSKLDAVRTTTMGKRNTTATIDLNGTDYVLTVVSTVSGTDPQTTEYKIADSKKVKLYYSKESGGGGRTEITSPVTLEFDRASGALKADGTEADGSPSYIRYIYAVQGSKEYGIKIYPETGKIQKED